MEDIITWAKALMSTDDWCVLDTETTGLSEVDEIIDIAILSKDGDVLLNQLIRSFKAISAEATAVHGITATYLVGAPPFCGAWPQIRNVLMQFRRVITYNAEFDERMLRQSARKAGLVLFMGDHAAALANGRRLDKMQTFALPLKWECLMKKYADYWGEPGRYGQCRWQRLEEACDQQRVSVGLGFQRWHRACGDAMAALSLIKVLAAKAEQPQRTIEPINVELANTEQGIEIFDIERGRYYDGG